MAVKDKIQYTAEDIARMLHRRFEGNGHVVLQEVADGTGYDQSRWIDVAVFSLWPSKGLTRAAFEIKVARSDFIHELQNPAKHQWVRESFHEFWFAGPREIFQDGELPEGAGLMCPRGDKLTIRTHSRRNNNPKLNDSLLAAFMRGASTGIDIAKARSKEDILAESHEYQRAKAFEEAVNVFCEGHGVISRLGLNKEESYKDVALSMLEEATTDNQLKQDRDHLLAVAGRFQREVTGLLGLTALIARHGVLSRNEAGKHVVDRWGIGDKDAVDALKKTTRWDHDKRYVEMIDLLMNWDKEFGGQVAKQK